MAHSESERALDHERHVFDIRNGTAICWGCEREAIVCPDCGRCSVCVAGNVGVAGAGHELVHETYGIH